ncbi:MAG TPA: M1 family metallopeptidase [Polyangiales bacterium]|nr:M1 family metallopeptidase [Polyangiales bacterium]
MRRRASCGLCLVVLLLAVHGTRASAQDLPAQDQRYDLEVTLDPAQHEVAGSERIHFVNHAARAVTELYFHLYPNAFAGKGTVFMREGGTRLRDGKLAHPGGIVLQELSAGGSDLLAHAEPELIAGDRTQLRVKLPEPLAPGAALDVVVRFRTRLPSLVSRAGFSGDFFMVAQFFPKLARLEPDGRWASFPYHGLGEFYADFADYTLRVRAPARFVIASGGRELGVQRDGDQLMHTFAARSVQDVAFAAYPYFVRSDSVHDGVSLRVFAPVGYDAAAARQTRVVRASLTHFAALFGRYPYDTLCVILPPREGHEAAGMEYPGLVVTAGPWWALPDALPDPEQDLVASHEIAHQWFSVMLGSNEVESPVLDEGLAEWATFDLERRMFAGSSTLGALRLSSHDLLDVARASLHIVEDHVPSSLLPAYRYKYEDLARAVYVRPVVVLDDLERRRGRAKLEQALGRYAREQRFRHPTLAELYAGFDHVYGAGFAERELQPALEGRLDSRPARAAAGLAAQTRQPSLFADLLFAAQALLQGFGP